MSGETATSNADVSAVLTDELLGWTGWSSGAIALPEEISASDLRRYVDATGDRNPLCADEAFARSRGYPGRLIPPMMVVEMSWRCRQDAEGQPVRIWHGILPLPPSYTDTRNAGLEIEWLKPVFVGDHLTLEHRITDITARQGRVGLGIYISRVTEYRRNGEEVVRVRQTVVKFPRVDARGGGAAAGA